LPCPDETEPLIGAAVSRDGGLTWEDRGIVLSNGYDFDCDYANGYFVGGNGDFTVMLGPEGRYFYFLFSNYAGPLEEQGIAIARSPVAARGEPGTLTKFFDGAWEEPGLGGRVTPIFPAVTSWKGPEVQALWGPSVHWNQYLRSYVALLNYADGANWAQGGIYITFSKDLLQWTQPEMILVSNDWYPQVIGLGKTGTDSLSDRFMRVYVGGISTIILEFSTAAGTG
jgi:hypothetical protein